MSGLPRTPKPNLLRSRAKNTRPDEEVIHGAANEVFDAPAGALLASIPWEGREPDPDSLSAQTFLGWL